MIEAKPDIVPVIEHDVILRNNKGLCPFHQERTPSFTVNPERQTFYCFGCGERGDVIDYVVKRDGVSFKDALQILGIRRGRPARPDPAVIRERERRRSFERWRWSYLCQLSDQAAEIHRIIREAKADPDMSEPLAWNYAAAAGELAAIEHGLDILVSNDREAIQALYEVVR